MKMTNFYIANYTPNMFLTKVASFNATKCWEEESNSQASNDSAEFNGIADWAKQNNQYKQVLLHFNLTEISNSDIYQIISSEFQDETLDDPK